MAGLNLRVKDFDGDVKSNTIEVSEPAADGSNLVAWSAGVDALSDAIRAVLVGRTQTIHKIIAEEVISEDKASSPVAQKNIVLVVEYVDNFNGRTYTEKFGTADLAQGGLWTVSGGLTVMDMSNANAQALQAAWDAEVLRDGNSVTFSRAYIEE